MGRFLVTGITFGVFMAEALIHYNMGKRKDGENFRFQLPPAKEMAKIAAVTGTFSVVSGALINTIQHRLNTKV